MFFCHTHNRLKDFHKTEFSPSSKVPLDLSLRFFSHIYNKMMTCQVGCQRSNVIYTIMARADPDYDITTKAGNSSITMKEKKRSTPRMRREFF